MSEIVSPLLHAGGYLVTQRDVVSLKNHEGDTNHFPVRFRREINPYDRIGVRYPLGAGASVSSLEFDPPNVKIGDSAGLSGARIGFVLVWSARGFTRECDPIEEALHRQLAAGYQLVCSSPRGLARLYRRL